MESRSQWHHSSVQRQSEVGSQKQTNTICGRYRGFRNMSMYPVEHICPTLHSDALKNSQHGKEDVVKVRDPAVGALPLAPALSPISFTKAPITSKCTR